MPSYTPIFNPIENIWGTFKKLIAIEDYINT